MARHFLASESRIIAYELGRHRWLVRRIFLGFLRAVVAFEYVETNES